MSERHAHTGAGNGASGSLVAAIAAHERGLLEKIQQAKLDAQRTIQEARAEAARHLSEEDEKINDEVAATRRAGERERERARAAVLSAREESLSQLRATASSRIPSVVDEIVALVVPGGKIS